MSPIPPIALVPAPGPSLCLDFVNTRYWRGSEPPTETLHGPDDLLAWAEGAGVADPASLRRLREAWRDDPAAAAEAFARAIALREALFRLGAALATDAAAGAAPDPADLAVVNAALAAAPARLALAPIAPGRLGWQVPGGAGGILPMIAVLWSAGDLLAGASRLRLRQCANPRCGWLFLDDSKAGTRRWCSMASCGNRAKAQRHYRKTRGQAERG